MSIADTRMSAKEINLLAEMVGKKFEKYRCDEFVFSPAVYQIVGLHVGGKVFALLNETRELDYFGDADDVAVISVKEAVDDEIKSHVVGGELAETPVDQVIEDVVIAMDTEFMSKDG